MYIQSKPSNPHAPGSSLIWSPLASRKSQALTNAQFLQHLVHISSAHPEGSIWTREISQWSWAGRRGDCDELTQVDGGGESVGGNFSSLSSSLSASNKSTSHWGFPSLFLSQWSPFVLRAWGFRSWGAFLIYLPFVFNLRFGLKYGQLSLILYLWVWCWMLRLC